MSLTRTGTGNRVTGLYTINASESHGSNLEAVGRNFGNSYSVTESVGGTSTMTRRGNAVTGAYTLSENTSDEWKYSHLNDHGSDGDFTLNAHGLNVFRRTDVGNDILGTYDRSWQGTDSFSMTETGHTTLGAFSEQLTGKEEYHLGESGNPDTGAFKREVKGNGSYDRVMSGPGATLPSGPGNFSYLNQETGNKKTGSFSLQESGASRYALLELWNNVSNTTAGFTPGQLDFFSFGVPFVDPGPGGGKNATDPSGMEGRYIIHPVGKKFQVWDSRNNRPVGMYPTEAAARNFIKQLEGGDDGGTVIPHVPNIGKPPIPVPSSDFDPKAKPKDDAMGPAGAVGKGLGSPGAQAVSGLGLIVMGLGMTAGSAGSLTPVGGYLVVTGMAQFGYGILESEFVKFARGA